MFYSAAKVLLMYIGYTSKVVSKKGCASQIQGYVFLPRVASSVAAGM